MKYRITRKTFFIAILTVVFGVFGIFGTIHQMNAEKCPYAIAIGGECPSATNVMAQIQHHIAGVQRLSLAVFHHVSIPIAVAFFSFFSSLSIALVVSRKIHERRTEHKIYSPRKQQCFWSALHNKFGDIVRLGARMMTVT